MPRPLRTLASALILTCLGGVLCAACAARPPIETPAIPAAAPAVVVTAAPTALARAAPAPSAPPPTGPGTIACGATRCRAGAELCCLGEPSRCVPAPAVPPGSKDFEEAEARQKACGSDHFLACDDAGDCDAGQTCCEETYVSETTNLWQGTCRPLRAGRAICQRAELCSPEDARCARKNNTCADVRGTLRCQLPLALRTHPRCGKKPCPAEMTCVEGEDGPTCTKGLFRNEVPLVNGVIECARGRDCGEGESCYQNPQVPGQRCDFALAGVDGLSEPAYCTGPEDCVAYCRYDEHAVPSCHASPKRRSGRCECLTPCAKDTDCAGCGRLANMREDEVVSDVAFCDRRKGGCDCRELRR